MRRFLWVNAVFLWCGGVALAACDSRDQSARELQVHDLVMQISGTKVLEGAALDCNEAQTLPAHRVCTWGFALNAPAASAAYDAVDQALRVCFRHQQDTGVNHPDTYRGVTYWTETARLTLVEKAKSAHDRTFLTLRIYRDPDS